MEGILYADKKCRKLRMGSFQWSPTLQYARDIINLQMYIIKKLKHMKASSSYIQRLERKVSILNSTNTTLKEAKIQLNDTYKRYTCLKKSDIHMRTTQLQELAARQAEAEGNNASSRYTTLIHEEEEQ